MNRIGSYIARQTSIAPLVSLRVLFGFIMAVSIIRFAANGWIHDLYVKPVFFFSYYGFEWVRPLGEAGMYIIFLIMLLAAIGIMIGFYYRVASVLFFVLFTYVELIDKTNYLNHYYFISLVSFLLIWVPANRSFSIDVLRKPFLEQQYVSRINIDIFKLQLAIVYLYAGIAKLNPEWLSSAMPLRIWLPANNHLPLIGDLLSQPWVAYVFSWMGAFYDLFIVFFLINPRTRLVAYGAVIAFHMITWWLFPIGMFPFIMILATLIFFSDKFHQNFISLLRKLLSRSENSKSYEQTASPATVTKVHPALISIIAIFFVIQIVMPWRFLLYPGDLFWTEQGYRFSWRVMLMEKAGYAIFHVKDPQTGREGDVMPGDYLTPIQEKMMVTQPDMILQFAHFLDDEFKKKGIADPEVRAEVYVTLNGKGSRTFIDSSVDLTKEKESWKPKSWIASDNL